MQKYTPFWKILVTNSKSHWLFWQLVECNFNIDFTHEFDCKHGSMNFLLFNFDSKINNDEERSRLVHM